MQKSEILQRKGWLHDGCHLSVQNNNNRHFFEIVFPEMKNSQT
jgi:hypothetical protein